MRYKPSMYDIDYQSKSDLMVQLYSTHSTLYSCLVLTARLYLIENPKCDDPCYVNKCYSGGTCTSDDSAPNGYTCTCPSGTSGTRCQNGKHRLLNCHCLFR